MEKDASLLQRSLFCYDSEKREAWRIYLDLFIDKKSDALPG
ncbi:MAG: hypothetical protein ACLVJ6_01130 [Merdibacter sp.]